MTGFKELRSLLYDELPIFARSLIQGERYRNASDPYRPTYANSPDSPLMHSPQWHQWGVITHTLKVREQFECTLPQKLQEWFGSSDAESRLGLLTETVAGVSKWELLLTAVPTHDWGKFTVRGLARKSGDTPKFRFGGHESESGALVRERGAWFRSQGMTGEQIEYLARCSELHFELGKARDTARNQGGYNLLWVHSSQFLRAVDKVTSRCPGFEREIGLFFLADNWGKTDLLDATEYATDQEISDLRDFVQREIRKRGLEPSLVNCALQLPVNTAVGRRYLESIR